MAGQNSRGYYDRMSIFDCQMEVLTERMDL
jgi:hypothetical protein